MALEKAALPYLRARDDEFERRIEEGVFVGHTTDLLSLYVLAFGVWEPYLSSFVRDRLHEGDVFVDVGANCGWYTLLGARQVGPSGTVIAVEPSAAIIERLRRQLERNRLDNVRVVEEAVSDHVGRVAIEPGPAEHTGLTRAIEESQAPESVPCRPLPQMMGASEWARVRLMKIDVEGAEFVAVQGIADRLPGLPPDAEIIVEVGPERARDPAEMQALFKVFDASGFHPYAIPNGYEVHDYLTYQPVDSFPRAEAAEIVEETNIVFSRVDEAALRLRQG
ncbi:MAG: FkbM family methyltransferase [Actinobacteria bacterium]|nr:FkbM family methyltransferase [Actinomycetota bacterium]